MYYIKIVINHSILDGFKSSAAQMKANSMLSPSSQIACIDHLHRLKQEGFWLWWAWSMNICPSSFHLVLLLGNMRGLRMLLIRIGVGLQSSLFRVALLSHNNSQGGWEDLNILCSFQTGLPCYSQVWNIYTWWTLHLLIHLS